MKSIRTTICSCGFGRKEAENGKPTKGLMDHFREYEKERKTHHQEQVEVWSS
jgi:hypothetical protein